MKTAMIWANLASGDMAKTRDFYSRLGFELNERHASDEMTSFRFGDKGFIINFFTRTRLNENVNGAIGSWREGQSEVIFSLSANSADEVDQWAHKVSQIGAKIVSEPQKYLEGYTFAFSDPDGHKFNVLYWPGM